MKIFNVQYSYQSRQYSPISEWNEHTTEISARDIKDAKGKANKKLQHLGCWLILDIYEK